MALIYMLAVHCRNEWVARALADKYAGQTFTLVGAHDMWGGDVCKFAAAAKLADGEWWAEIVPSGVTSTGISNDQEASRANQLCNVMYGSCGTRSSSITQLLASSAASFVHSKS
jgi:hypothetical protein